MRLTMKVSRPELELETQDWIECSNKDGPRQKISQKFQTFEMAQQQNRDMDYEAIHRSAIEKFRSLLQNQLFNPSGANVPQWCASPESAWAAHGSVANFIVKCLWYPLYDHGWPAVQKIKAIHRQFNVWAGGMMFYSYKRGLEWKFEFFHTCPAESTSDDPGEGINYTVIANDKLDDTIFAERELQTVTDSLVLECPAGEVISGLFLKQVFPRGSRSAMITKWTPMAAIDCTPLGGNVKLVSNTVYTVDNSKIASDKGILPWQSSCARDYAVLQRVEFKGQGMKSTCQYVAQACV
ncbi:unnamed protein product [Symbiodinium pilosum]|uniref:Uncharacterized protein n=1 Tax=Symbiodinium pilosum TaxID=2952 RepID=A0A812SDT6_SYMPI|nr:unnamed protein product [Symbiodinium pilosum]